MIERNAPTTGNTQPPQSKKPAEGPIVVVEKNVPTTQNTEPQQASYPLPRKPALGPLITTSNTEPPKKKKSEPIMNIFETPAIPKKRRGRPKVD